MGHKKHLNCSACQDRVQNLERQNQIKAEAFKIGVKELMCPSSRCFLCLFSRVEFHNFTAEVKGIWQCLTMLAWIDCIETLCHILTQNALFKVGVDVGIYAVSVLI